MSDLKKEDTEASEAFAFTCFLLFMCALAVSWVGLFGWLVYTLIAWGLS